MATMNMSVKYDIPDAEALKRIKKLLEETKKQYGDLVTDVKESWKGNVGTFSFTARGYSIAGTITVQKQEILLQGEVPWALSFMKGKIEKILSARAKELLY